MNIIIISYSETSQFGPTNVRNASTIADTLRMRTIVCIALTIVDTTIVCNA